MTTMESDIYYDPYDFEIDTDPYPVWKRLRDEEPLYYNERYDFYALSRFDDVERLLGDWRTYISAKGTLLEMIKSRHRAAAGDRSSSRTPPPMTSTAVCCRTSSRPGKINDLEPKIRDFCARSLDPLVGRRVRLHRRPRCPMPMRTIGMLLGIPESDQEAIRDRIDEGLRLTEGTCRTEAYSEGMTAADGFAEYIDWRATHPSDDLMTELLKAEFEDVDGYRASADPRRGPRLRQPAGRSRQRDHDPPDRLDGKGAG